MTKTTLTTVLAAIAVLAAAPAAFAASHGDTITFKVSTAGLNLRTSRDAHTMLRRIETAAGALCGEAPYIGDLDAAHDYGACVSHNVGQALTQLDAPLVSEVARQSTAVQSASNGN